MTCAHPLPPVVAGISPLPAPTPCPSLAAAVGAAAPVPHTGAALGDAPLLVGALIAAGVVLFFLALVVYPLIFPEGGDQEPDELPPLYPRLTSKLRPRCICGQLASYRVTLPAPVAAHPKPFYGCARAARTFERHIGARLEAL